MNVNQRQLHQLVVTATVGRLSQAAAVLHLSQSALSRSLQDLQDQLGVVLFERSGRQLRLNDEGERFLPIAQRLLGEMQRAVAELHQPGAPQVVRVAVGTAFGTTVLPVALAHMARTQPQVRWRLVDDNSAGITQRVLRGEADIGFGSLVGPGLAAAGRLQCTRLLRAAVGLLGSDRAFPGLKAAAVSSGRGAWLRWPLLKEPLDTSIAQLLRAQGSDLVGEMEHGHEVSNLTLQTSLAAQGLGVAVVSALGASHPSAHGLRFVPLRPRTERELFAMVLRDRPSPRAAGQLVAAVQDVLAQRAVALHRLVRVDRPGAVGQAA
jgi:LysR family transcriptional regulator, carnitine catabolism transcriptional activator